MEQSGWCRRTGRPRKSWKDYIKEWTGQSMSPLLRIADDRSRWEPITAEASVGVPQQRVVGISCVGIRLLLRRSRQSVCLFVAEGAEQKQLDLHREFCLQEGLCFCYRKWRHSLLTNPIEFSHPLFSQSHCTTSTIVQPVCLAEIYPVSRDFHFELPALRLIRTFGDFLVFV